ncbi:MAG: hypothetical protein ABIK44_03390 [candidate division WOR-3 bacterium]
MLNLAERSHMPGRFRTNVDRLARFEAKTRPERVMETSEDIRQAAVQRHGQRQTELAAFELQAKEAIDGLNLSVTLYLSYLNYCRELWKKANTYGGAVLRRETEAIIAKWAARDLDETILRKLRKELINVT